MPDFTKNNLDRATSPYLQQHQDNPVHWQEWSNEVIEYAKKQNKILLVSSGYATCHWCHVMAAEAFSDQGVADYLNAHFVCIKIDKEQRPDIDHYLMSFMQESQGQGGWPLNVFLTPDLKPIVAVTYLPIAGFLSLLQELKEKYLLYKDKIIAYVPSVPQQEAAEETEVISTITSNFTGNSFGYGPQFPPHNTLLFLISYYEKSKEDEIRKIIENLLEAMAARGLHDHLQGGFFRYCIDASWTIPHFEKMLYDQAMLLWVYSAVSKVLGKPEYKIIIEKIITCLEDTYAHDGLYYSAHDADTDHHEGLTYLWNEDELKRLLTEDEFKQFIEAYETLRNVEGKIHLVKKKNGFLPEIEQKLLKIRKKRKQPFTDRKIVTSWNALLGVGMIMAYRALGNEVLKAKAMVLFQRLVQEHYREHYQEHHQKTELVHSSFDGQFQSGEFLEDYAAVLLLATYLHEETGEHKSLIQKLSKKVGEFKDGERWLESKTTDFMAIPAQSFDHPTPSTVSLAEMALLRAKIIVGEKYELRAYQLPLHSDFFNLMAFIANGNWHIIHTPHKIEWKHLPLNSIQIIDKNKNIQDCYGQQCREFKDVTELLGMLGQSIAEDTNN